MMLFFRSGIMEFQVSKATFKVEPVLLNATSILFSLKVKVEYEMEPPAC